MLFVLSSREKLCFFCFCLVFLEGGREGGRGPTTVIALPLKNGACQLRALRKGSCCEDGVVGL